MATQLTEVFASRMAALPPPTAEEIASLAAFCWQLVAEAAGIVEFRPGGNPLDPGDIYLTPLGLKWLGVTKTDTTEWEDV